MKPIMNQMFTTGFELAIIVVNQKALKIVTNFNKSIAEKGLSILTTVINNLNIKETAVFSR